MQPGEKKNNHKWGSTGTTGGEGWSYRHLGASKGGGEKRTEGGTSKKAEPDAGQPYRQLEVLQGGSAGDGEDVLHQSSELLDRVPGPDQDLNRP